MTDFSLMKLGKNPAVIDYRTIKMASFLRILPPYPEAFDVDSQYPNLKDTPRHQSILRPDLRPRNHFLKRWVLVWVWVLN